MNCECGCGLKAPVYRGRQCRYLRGHCGAQKARKKIRYVVEEVTGCWIWLLAMRDGYGIEKVGGKYGGAHFHSYEKYRGLVPAGMVLDHAVCRNRRCINPWHLEVVTSAVNTRRGRNAKITQEIAEEMRRMKACGATQTEIAQMFGVSQSLVSDVVRGNTWKSTISSEPGLTKTCVTQLSRDSFAAGFNKQAVAAATGTGKTVIFANLLAVLAGRKEMQRFQKSRAVQPRQALTGALVDDSPCEGRPMHRQPPPLHCFPQPPPYSQIPLGIRINRPHSTGLGN
jgi:hypothetical protein